MGGEDLNFLSNPDVVKTNEGGGRKPKFVILLLGVLELSASGWWWREA